VRPLLPMLASGKLDKMALRKEAEKIMAGE
jgi:hypothetical protein